MHWISKQRVVVVVLADSRLGWGTLKWLQLPHQVMPGGCWACMVWCTLGWTTPSAEYLNFCSDYLTTFWVGCCGWSTDGGTGKGRCITVRQKNYVVLFSEHITETLAWHLPIFHPVESEPGINFLFCHINNVLQLKLTTLNTYIQTNQLNKCMHQWLSDLTRLMVLPKKQDSGLWQCMDYQSVNEAWLMIW